MAKRRVYDPETRGLLTLLITTVLVHPEPNTNCELCWQAEAPWLARMRRALGMNAGPGNPFGIGSVIAAMLGAPASWYDRHRAEWIRTGDPLELERMTRHVKGM